MSDKPSYLKVLNAIAVGEARGHALFDAWAKATRDAELANTLNVVAIRECEHAAVFTKRLCELGYSVLEKPAEDFETRLQTLRSDVSDAEKFESVFGYGRERGDEGLGGIFADTTIDPLHRQAARTLHRGRTRHASTARGAVRTRQSDFGRRRRPRADLRTAGATDENHRRTQSASPEEALSR